MASDLSKNFDASRQIPSGQSLEELRQHYYIQASMSGSDEASIGGIQVNTNGRKDTAALALKKQQQATNDALMLAELSRQLEAITNRMVDKYGEDFADNLAAEYLDEDTYKKLMKIEDPEERRLAIAKAINEGIENGTIDADAVYGNSDVKEWLDISDKITQKQCAAETEIALNTQSNLDTDNSSSSMKNTTLEMGLDKLLS